VGVGPDTEIASDFTVIDLSVRGATRAALRLLEQYAWRGNVRQLEAVLEQAMIFRSGDWITPEDLDLPMRRGGDVVEGHS
jgi:DNA-binding NtrC family response regulator